jgi:hypothetical protein
MPTPPVGVITTLFNADGDKLLAAGGLTSAGLGGWTFVSPDAPKPFNPIPLKSELNRERGGGWVGAFERTSGVLASAAAYPLCKPRSALIHFA